MTEAHLSVKATPETKISNEAAKEMPNKLFSNAINATKNETPASSIEKAAEANLKNPETAEKLKNALIDDSSTRIKTINEGLVDSTHPETDIQFKLKESEQPDGTKVEVVMPEFAPVYETTLNKNEDGTFVGSRAEHESQCNERLKEALNNDPLLTEKFSDQQLEQIKDGETPDGYSWHHDAEPGRMQLVDAEIHSKTGHTGGYSIWGKPEAKEA